MFLVLEGSGHDHEAAQALLQEHGYAVSLRSADLPEAAGLPQRAEPHAHCICDNGHLGIFRSSLDGQLMSINPAGARMFKYDSPQEMIETVNRTSVLEALYVDSSHRREILAVTFSSEDWHVCEKQFHCKDGSVIDCNFHIRAVRDADGRPFEMEGFYEDISERKETERALQRTQFTVEKSIDQAFWITPEGRFFYVNEAACASLGYSRAELEGMGIWDINPHVTLENAGDYWRQLKAEGSMRSETSHRAKDGRIYPVEVRCNYFNFDGKEFSCAFATDISERKQVEEALEKRLIALTRPLDDSSGVSFDELFNLDDIQRLQDDFAQATGVASLITLPDGSPITGPSSFCRLCDIIRSTEKGTVNCIKSDAALGRPASSGPVIQHCLSAGLLGAGSAISVGGRHIANWLIGQVRDEHITEEQMRGYARQVGADEEAAVEAFSEVPIMSRKKFGQVAQTLHTLARQLSSVAYQNVQQARFITERKHAEEALGESDCRYRSIVEHAPFGISRSTLDGKLRSVNPALVAMLKYDSGPELLETVNCSSLHEVLFLNPSERAAHVEKILASDSWQVYNNRLRCKDGSFVDCRVHSRWIVNEDGRTGEFESYQENITDQLAAEQAKRKSEDQIRASLAEKDVLLREIHHRVKNNLQVVSSLLYLQSQKFSDPELQACLLESQSRICSMALAHEQLYQSKNLAEISVKSYVESLVGQLKQVFLSPGQEIDCQLVVEDLPLDIEKVVPCGLLITELLSNAYKHAFADGCRGQVTISLQSDAGQIELAVADDGVGFPPELDYRRTKTFGLQLVTALVNQLDGTLEMESRYGTRFAVRFDG